MALLPAITEQIFPFSIMEKGLCRFLSFPSWKRAFADLPLFSQQYAFADYHYLIVKVYWGPETTAGQLQQA